MTSSALIFLIAARLSFNSDILPIIRNRCSTCHNQTWPAGNWLDYNTAFKNRIKIKTRLENYSMPPGNSTQLSQKERQLIIDWVNQGAPE